MSRPKQLVDCVTSYLTGSEKSGTWGQFTFEGDVGYLDGQKISKVIMRGTKRYLLVNIRIHHLYDALIRIAGRLGVDEVILPDRKLLDGTEGWDKLFYAFYTMHIRGAARADSDVQFRYRVVLANRTRRHANDYATVLGLDWDSVAHMFTPDYVLKDDYDLLTQFALRDMGLEQSND